MGRLNGDHISNTHSRLELIQRKTRLNRIPLQRAAVARPGWRLCATHGARSRDPPATEARLARKLAGAPAGAPACGVTATASSPPSRRPTHPPPFLGCSCAPPPSCGAPPPPPIRHGAIPSHPFLPTPRIPTTSSPAVDPSRRQTGYLEDHHGVCGQGSSPSRATSGRDGGCCCGNLLARRRRQCHWVPS